MRRRIAFNGAVFVALDAGLQPHIEPLGLPLDEDETDFINEAKEDVASAIGRLKGSARKDPESIKEAARLATRRAAQRWSGKRPQVRVMLVG